MKKNLILGLFVTALAAAGLYLAFSDNGEISKSPFANEYDFAVPDTASITKILISDKTPSKVELIRVNGVWLVNGEAPARTDAIAVLLETFHHVAMKSFVTKEARNTVLKRMDVFGKHVELYAGDVLLKSFMVGTETPDQLGSYMKLDGAKDPYAMYLPGFNGYLNSRFFTDENKWRKRTIWGFDNRDIKTVQLNYNHTPSQSFRLEVLDNTHTIYNTNGEKIKHPNLGKIHAFLAGFRNTMYEGAIVPTDGIYSKMDSLKSSGEIFTIYVQPKKGNAVELKAYHIKAKPDTYDIHDQLRQWDPDRLYGIINGKTFVLVQYYGLQNVLKKLSDFKE